MTWNHPQTITVGGFISGNGLVPEGTDVLTEEHGEVVRTFFLFFFFLSMSKILPRETNCDGPFYHRTAWTHEEDWCLIVICLCFSAFEWFQFSFTAWHACLPSTEHPPPPPTEAWCCALTLIYRTGLGRAQWSYLCLTKTLTWYIATYSFCGLSTAIQSEWAGGQRQVRRPLQQENWIMEATLHHHLATLQKWQTGKGLWG